MEIFGLQIGGNAGKKTGKKKDKSYDRLEAGPIAIIKQKIGSVRDNRIQLGFDQDGLFAMLEDRSEKKRGLIPSLLIEHDHLKIALEEFQKANGSDLSAA